MEFKGDYSFLSNFYPLTQPIVIDNLSFPTVEHAFQALKCVNREDREYISRLATPGEAKRAGKTFKMREDWNDIRVEVMEYLLTVKFSDVSLQTKLRMTAGPIIETNSWHDNFWGACLCIRCNDSGQNRLGKLLMKIRDSYNK